MIFHSIQESIDMQADELKKLIETVISAGRDKDEDTIFDLSSDIMSVYLEALSDIHFDGSKAGWLNEMVAAIDNGDTDSLLSILDQEEDSDDRFLGSQVAALFAGFRQRDAMMTVVQAAGIKALLENM